jgi:hypothetical protein
MIEANYLMQTVTRQKFLDPVFNPSTYKCAGSTLLKYLAISIPHFHGPAKANKNLVVKHCLLPWYSPCSFHRRVSFAYICSTARNIVARLCFLAALMFWVSRSCLYAQHSPSHPSRDPQDYHRLSSSAFPQVIQGLSRPSRRIGSPGDGCSSRFYSSTFATILIELC